MEIEYFDPLQMRLHQESEAEEETASNNKYSANKNDSPSASSLSSTNTATKSVDESSSICGISDAKTSSSSSHHRENTSKAIKSLVQRSSWLIVLSLFLLITACPQATNACSSRSTPKPRPYSHLGPQPGGHGGPSSTMLLRPNITFQTYACPPAYAAWYCLNGATCFTVKIADSLLYNCECADGYMGQRCEFKDLDGTYLPAFYDRLRAVRALLPKNSVALGSLLAVVGLALCAVLYSTRRNRGKLGKVLEEENNNPEVLSQSVSYRVHEMDAGLRGTSLSCHVATTCNPRVFNYDNHVATTLTMQTTIHARKQQSNQNNSSSCHQKDFSKDYLQRSLQIYPRSGVKL